MVMVEAKSNVAKVSHFLVDTAVVFDYTDKVVNYRDILIATSTIKACLTVRSFYVQ